MLVYFVLIFATLILSQAGIVIRFADTHYVTVAFYRLLFATIILAPFSIGSLKKSYSQIDKRAAMKIFLMGVFFALHFFFWIKAVQTTKVAHAAICFALNPAFISVGAFLFLKEKIDSRTIIGLVIGFIGIIVIASGDLSFHDFNKNNFLGDIYALLGGLSFAIYFLLGKSIRKHIGNRFLMTAVYGVGALLSLTIIFYAKLPLGNFSNHSTWVALLVLAVFQTILGHASIIYILKFMKASFVSTFLLVEPLLAGIVAFFLFNEHVALTAWLGYLLIIIGICFLFRDQQHD